MATALAPWVAEGVHLGQVARELFAPGAGLFGQLTQAQQARWGQQIYDALFPF